MKRQSSADQSEAKGTKKKNQKKCDYSKSLFEYLFMTSGGINLDLGRTKRTKEQKRNLYFYVLGISFPLNFQSNGTGKCSRQWPCLFWYAAEIS